MGKFMVSLVVEVEAEDHQGAVEDALGISGRGDGRVTAAVALDLVSKEARAFTVAGSNLEPGPVGVPL